jgi:4a-hydroxytetrahydrobiopterin dehydratase
MILEMQTIQQEEAVVKLRDLPDWGLEGAALRRELKARSFPDALAFVVRLAFAAEAADHHPDILLSYRHITLSYSTHSAGGLTEKDFEGARAASALAAEMGVR